MPDPYESFSSVQGGDPYASFSSPAGQEPSKGTRLYSPNPDAPQWAGGPDTVQTTGTIPRVIGQFAQHTNDALVRGVSAIPDLSGSFSRAIGLVKPDTPPISDAYVQAVDDLASVPRRFRDAFVKGSLGPIFADRESYKTRFEPQGPAERAAASVGDAFGTVAGTAIPAGVVSDIARVGSTPKIVADAMKANPVQQGVALAAGNLAGDATDNKGVGIATTLALPLLTHGAQRTFSAAPAANTQEAERRALLEFGRKNDLGPLTAGKMTDSGKLQTYEGAINRLPIPFLGGRVKATEEAGRDAWQKALLERAGITGETAATPQVIENGKAALSNRFNGLTANTTLNVTPKFGMDLAGIKSEYGHRLFEDVQPGLMKRLDELATAPAALGGAGAPAVTIDGRAYQNIRSDLSRISGTAPKPADRQAAGKMVEALDDVAEGSMPKDQMKDWRQVRQQWRNLLAVENSVTGSNNAQTAVGNIPVARFGRESQGNPDIERFGQYGNKFVGEKMPYDTASRHSVGHLLTGALGAVGGTAGAHGHLPITPYTIAAAGVAAAPFAADLAMNNPFTRALLAARYRYPSNSIVTKGLVGTLAAQEAAQQGR